MPATGTRRIFRRKPRACSASVGGREGTRTTAECLKERTGTGEPHFHDEHPRKFQPCQEGQLLRRRTHPREAEWLPLRCGRATMAPGNDFILTPNESMASTKMTRFFAGPAGPKRPAKTACGEADRICKCHSATRQPTAFRFRRRTTRVAPASPVGRGLRQPASPWARPGRAGTRASGRRSHTPARQPAESGWYLERLVAPGVEMGLATTVVRGIRPFSTGRPLPRPGAEASPRRHRRPQNAGRARGPHRWFLSPNVG